MDKTVRFVSIFFVLILASGILFGTLQAQDDTPVATAIQFSEEGPRLDETFPAPCSRTGLYYHTQGQPAALDDNWEDPGDKP